MKPRYEDLCFTESERWEILRQRHVVALLRAERVWLHPEIKLSGCTSHCWSRCDFYGSGGCALWQDMMDSHPGEDPVPVSVHMCVHSWPHLSTSSCGPQCCLHLLLVFVCVYFVVFVKDRARIFWATPTHVSKSRHCPKWTESHMLTNK